MAKRATGKSSSSSGSKARASGSRSVARASSGGERRSSGGNGFDASEAFVKLLQSPLVAELVAVAATAALAALAEQGFTNGERFFKIR